MADSKIIILIALIIYLVGMPFLLSAMGNTYKGLDSHYSDEVKTFGSSFGLNIMIALDILPIWINVFLITIPIGLLVWFIILITIHG